MSAYMQACAHCLPLRRARCPPPRLQLCLYVRTVPYHPIRACRLPIPTSPISTSKPKTFKFHRMTGRTCSMWHLQLQSTVTIHRGLPHKASTRPSTAASSNIQAPTQEKRRAASLVTAVTAHSHRLAPPPTQHTVRRARRRRRPSGWGGTASRAEQGSQPAARAP